jgi:hypothetical protein
MPKDLGEISPTPPENEEITSMRIALQALLNLKRQTLHSSPHVGIASRDPDTAACGERDQLRNAFKVAATNVGEAFVLIWIRAVFISTKIADISGALGCCLGGMSPEAIFTSAKPAPTFAPRASRRHL